MQRSSKASRRLVCAGRADGCLIVAEIAEIVENLHRQDLSTTERMQSVARLKTLGDKLEEQREAMSAAKESEAINSTNVEKIASSKTRPKKGTGAKRGRKVGSVKADSNVSIAKQFGIADETVRRDNKRNKALGPAIVDRIAKLPVFDKAKIAEAKKARDAERGLSGEKTPDKKTRPEAQVDANVCTFNGWDHSLDRAQSNAGLASDLQNVARATFCTLFEPHSATL